MARDVCQASDHSIIIIESEFVSGGCVGKPSRVVGDLGRRQGKVIGVNRSNGPGKCAKLETIQ